MGREISDASSCCEERSPSELNSPARKRPSGLSICRMPSDSSRRLINDYIASTCHQESMQETCCTILSHPAQELQSPGAVISIWGSATTPSDQFLPFFAKKPLNFDGDIKRLKHYVGVMSHRGYKPEMPNQDDFFLLARSDSMLFGVLDGHGPEGHDVSHFAQERLPKHITRHLREEPDAWVKAVQASMCEVCNQARTEITNKSDTSGSTATIAMLDQPQKSFEAGLRPLRLRCTWLGDSGAVWAKRKGSHSPWEVLSLVDTHRPDRADERERIKLAGGSVSAACGRTPGRLMTPEWHLAVSRSIGDFQAVPYGLSSDPEFSRDFWLEPEYEHLILMCSDGIWDVMDAQQAVKFVAKFSPSEAQLAVERLISKAQRRWQEKEDAVDDITAMLIWPNFVEDPRASSRRHSQATN